MNVSVAKNRSVFAFAIKNVFTVTIFLLKNYPIMFCNLDTNLKF